MQTEANQQGNTFEGKLCWQDNGINASYSVDTVVVSPFILLGGFGVVGTLLDRQAEVVAPPFHVGHHLLTTPMPPLQTLKTGWDT